MIFCAAMLQRFLCVIAEATKLGKFWNCSRSPCAYGNSKLGELNVYTAKSAYSALGATLISSASTL